MKPAWMEQSRWEKLKDLKSEERKRLIKQIWDERQKELVKERKQSCLI